MKRPFYLKLRGRFWYLRLNKSSGIVNEDEQVWRATGCTGRDAAERFVVNLIASSPHTYLPVLLKSFRDYAEPFFDWDRCPHVRRLREVGKSITERYARFQRSRLQTYIFPDALGRKRMSEVKRVDVFDFRSRLSRIAI